MSDKSQLKKGMAVASSNMERSLIERVDEQIIGHGDRHNQLEKFLINWLDKWDAGSMPAVFIGARAHSSVQRSFYLREETAARLKQAALDSGVSVSHVIRTALAWRVAGRLKPRDVWLTPVFFSDEDL